MLTKAPPIGPVITPTLAIRIGVPDALTPVDPAESLDFVCEAIRLTRAALDRTVPLIGFAGAPFTLASYIIEGGSSRNYEKTKTFMYRQPQAWHELMNKLTDLTAKYLNLQISAGAQGVQIFDSWVGCLSEADYRTFVQPHSRKVIEGITDGVPVIHFGTGTAHLLESMRDAGGDVIGLDWRVSLGSTWARLGSGICVQGNLDPVVLFAEPAEIRRAAARILEEAGGRPGHIFNLGHGILPGTPFDHVRYLVDAVHELGSR